MNEKICLKRSLWSAFSLAASLCSATMVTQAADPAGQEAQGTSPTVITSAPSVLATQEFNSDPNLRCDVVEVKRVSGGALLIKWRLANRAAEAGGGGLAADPAKKIYHEFSWNAVYLTDAAENKKYLGLKDSAGSWIGQGDNKYYASGEQQTMWMKFPAPPPTSTKITFVFPGFPPFEDLPVSQ